MITKINFASLGFNASLSGSKFTRSNNCLLSFRKIISPNNYTSYTATTISPSSSNQNELTPHNYSTELLKELTNIKEARSKRKSWTEAELKELVSLVDQHGTRFTTIQKHFSNKVRTVAALATKYKIWVASLNKDKIESEWTPQEDHKLRIGILTFGVGEWGKISEYMKTKDISQISRRWQKISQTRRGRWTAAENAMLEKLHNDHGKQWAQFAGILGRPARNIRVHYSFQFEKWSKQEDELLTNSLKEFGFNWEKILERFPNRTIRKLKSRVDKCTSINPFVNHGAWTAEEQKLYEKAICAHGSKWLDVALVVKTRTPKQCANHYTHYVKSFCSDREKLLGTYKAKKRRRKKTRFDQLENIELNETRMLKIWD
ncbi:3652_t:CDS:1 [Gigaspora margarita]|uniref:3652_t:CDS:1 n=2 Tax=Gigaspora margarita TaxID=4874 RepID=A0ABN7VVF1_GIGMA|nr:myb-like protein L isoform X5 [Gigaspora margarita]CAG8801054.1 3652_t:CDS:1 [Gigaspora margarita]